MRRCSRCGRCGRGLFEGRIRCACPGAQTRPALPFRRSELSVWYGPMDRRPLWQRALEARRSAR